VATQHRQGTQQVGLTPQTRAAVVASERGALLLVLGILFLASLSRAGRDWTDFFCACVRLALTALPSVALAASHALQTHAGQRIVEGLLQVSGCLGTLMLNLITH
jgi:hypothetical protein